MKTKTKKVKVPRAPKMPKRSVMEDFAAMMQEVFAVGEAPAVKKVTEKNGLYTAYNERGQPVAYFGRAFARALNEFIPLIAPSNMLSAGHENYRTSGIQSFVASAPSPDATKFAEPGLRHEDPGAEVEWLYVVARNQEAFDCFVRKHKEQYPCRSYEFRRISQPSDLLGIRFGRRSRLVRLYGWTDGMADYFRRLINQAKSEERDAIRNGK